MKQAAARTMISSRRKHGSQAAKHGLHKVADQAGPGPFPVRCLGAAPPIHPSILLALKRTCAALSCRAIIVDASGTVLLSSSFRLVLDLACVDANRCNIHARLEGLQLTLTPQCLLCIYPVCQTFVAEVPRTFVLCVIVQFPARSIRAPCVHIRLDQLQFWSWLLRASL